MISHVILFQPKADLSHADRQALLDAFERAVRDIPVVRGVRTGRRLTHGAGYEQSTPSLDVLVAIDFDDLDALQAYLRHPAHAELGARFTQSIGSGWVFDFELASIAELSGI